MSMNGLIRHDFCCYPWFLLSIFSFMSSSVFTDHLSKTSTTPATRIRGEIGCYSCVSLADHRSNVSRRWSSSSSSSASASPWSPTPKFNSSRFARLFYDGGMRMPRVVSRCAETGLTARPNFFGVQLRFCRNTPQQPGACVKLKGFFDGNWFVYRECWDRMWLDPRPYKHSLSGRCYADELVQNFISSERNVICFCEEDMCNGAVIISRPTVIRLIGAILAVIIVINHNYVNDLFQ